MLCPWLPGENPRKGPRERSRVPWRLWGGLATPSHDSSYQAPPAGPAAFSGVTPFQVGDLMGSEGLGTLETSAKDEPEVSQVFSGGRAT